MTGRKIIYIVLLALFAGGCAAPKQEVKRRYFWPPPPLGPRIEFLGAYSGESDLKKEGAQKFWESILGEEQHMAMTKPWGIHSDGKGKVYVVDTQERRVVVFDFNGNSVYSFGKDAYLDLFGRPIGITQDGSGNIYVSDASKAKVFVFTRDEKPLRAIGGGILKWPVGMAVDNDLRRLYVTDVRIHGVAVFDFTGKHLFTIGKRGTGDGEFNFPTDVELDSAGNLIVADSMNARIQILDPDGRFIRKFGRRGDGVADFQLIKGVAVDRSTDNIYVSDGRGNKFLVFSKSGAPLISIGGQASLRDFKRVTPGGFLLPADITIDDDGKIYVVDSMNRRFQVFKIIDEEWLKKHPIR